MGESAYLTRQAQLAKQAMGRAASELGAVAARAADPRPWAQHHPWMTLGASAVAGFVATALLVPSKEQSALKRLAEIERALNPQPPAPKHPSKGDNGNVESGEHGYKTGRQSFGRALMTEVIGALKPAIISLISAGVSAKAAKPSEAEMQAAATAADYNQGNVGPGGMPPPDSGLPQS